MKLVVKLLGLLMLCLPVFTYGVNEESLAAVNLSFLTTDEIWHLAEMYGSVVLIVVGVLSLGVARKRQKSLSA